MIREDKSTQRIRAKVEEIHGKRNAPKPAIKNYTKLTAKTRSNRIKNFLKRQGIEVVTPKK